MAEAVVDLSSYLPAIGQYHVHVSGFDGAVPVLVVVGDPSNPAGHLHDLRVVEPF